MSRTIVRRGLVIFVVALMLLGANAVASLPLPLSVLGAVLAVVVAARVGHWLVPDE